MGETSIQPKFKYNNISTMSVIMKKIIIITLLIFVSKSKAQTIIPLYQSDKNVEGAYYKDINNDLNNFVGTWKYTNGTTSLTIVLQKKEMQYYNDGYINYYHDVIIGGYRYVENGLEKINTLSQLQLNLMNAGSYYLYGDGLLGQNSSGCPDCGPNERKLLVGFVDPDRDIFGMESLMTFRRADQGNVQRLRLIFYLISGGIEEPGQVSQFPSYTVPFGEYIMIKE